MVNAGPFHGTVVENLSSDLQDAEVFIFRVCQCRDRKGSENTAGQQSTLTKYLMSLHEVGLEIIRLEKTQALWSNKYIYGQ